MGSGAGSRTIGSGAVMPLDDTGADAPPPPPPGFTLDAAPPPPPQGFTLDAGPPPPPPGFKLDQAPQWTKDNPLVPKTQDEYDAAPVGTPVKNPKTGEIGFKGAPPPPAPEVDQSTGEPINLQNWQPAVRDTGIMGAIPAGLLSAGRQLKQTSQVIAGGTPEPTSEEAQPLLAAQPVEWGDFLHPMTLAKKSLYQLAQSAPTIAAGIMGGEVGGAAGALVPFGGETGVTEAGGAILGGGLGAYMGTTLQSLGSQFANELKDNPKDPEAAYNKAWDKANVEGALSGVGWASFGIAPFKSTFKNVVFQAFGIQPGVAAAGQAAQNVAEGQPIGQGVAQQIPGAIIGTAAPLAGHMAIQHLMGHGEAAPTETTTATEAQPAAPPAPAPAPEGAVPPPSAPAPDVAARAMEVADRLEASGDVDAAARLRAQYAQPAPEAPPPAPPTLLDFDAVGNLVPARPEPTPDHTTIDIGGQRVVDTAGPVPSTEATLNAAQEGRAITTPPEEPKAAEPSALDQLKQGAAAVAEAARTGQPANLDTQLAGAEQQLQKEAEPTPSREPVGQQLIAGMTEPQAPRAPEAPVPVPPIAPAILPQTAPQVPIPVPAPPALNYRPIRDDQAMIPSSGQAFPITYGVADAHDLVTSNHDDLSPNPAYPQALQPRSRERAETEAQLSSILNGGREGAFRPELLGENPDAANGAPIVGEDGLVEGGNARTMAIRRAYDRGLPQAEQYRLFLASQGYPVEGMQAPMLVRVNRAGMEMPQREQLARDLNVPPQAAMSPSDQAMADSAQIRPEQLRSYQGGDIFSGQNVPFLLGVLRGMVRTNELPALLNPDGGLSPAGRTRVRNALLAKAYGDSGLVSTLTEDADNNIKSIGNALTDAAPAWARLRQDVADGTVSPVYDMTSPLLEAVRLIAHARDEGRNIKEFTAQRGMFGEGVAPETEIMLSWMLGPPEWSKRYGREKIADTISGYADSITRPRRIGEALPAPAELVENARQVAHGAAGDLFASPLGEPGSATAVRASAGENGAEVQGREVNPLGLEPPAGGAAEPRGAADPAAEVAKPVAEPKALFDEAQAIMRTLPQNMGRILQRGGKYTAAQQAKLDRLAEIDKLLPQTSPEWSRLMAEARGVRDANLTATRAAHGQQQAARAQEAGFAVGDKVSYHAASGLPGVRGTTHEGVVRQSADGTIYVSSGGKRLDLFRNPWNKTEPETGPLFREEGQARSPVTARDLTPDFQAFHRDGQYADMPNGDHHAARDWVWTRGRETGNEHLAAYDDEAGHVSYAGTSDMPDAVSLPDEVMRPGANLIIHHNHPADRGLSSLDIAALSYPGVARIVAHTHDGDVFSAELTPAAKEWVRQIGDQGEAFRALNRATAAAANPISEALYGAFQSGRLSREDGLRAEHDLLGRALDAAGIIHYASSRDAGLLPDGATRNLIAEAAQRAQMMAAFRRQDAPAFTPPENVSNAVLDRSTQPIGYDEAMARASSPHAGSAAGRPVGAGGGGERGAGVGGEGEGPGQLREEGQLPNDAARLAQEHEEAGHAALQAGNIDEATQHFSAAARAREGGGGGEPPQPPGEPPAPPGGGEPPSGPMSPAERTAALNQIQSTNDERWPDRLKQVVNDTMDDRPGVRFRQYWQDRQAALEHAEKGIYGGQLAPRDISPTQAMRMAKNWGSTFKVMMTRSQVRYNRDTGQVEAIEGSKPLRAIFQPLKDAGKQAVDDFALWAITKRAERLMAEGREHNVSADIIARARNIDQEYQRPDGSNLFHQVHADMQEWNKNLLGFAQSAGLVSPEIRALFEHDDYVPFFRALDEDRVGGPATGATGNLIRSPIRRLEGGEQKINNIYENMVRNAAAMTRRSMENLARQKTRDMLVEHTATLTPMSKDARVVFGDPAVQASLRAVGLDPAAMTAAAKQGAADLFGALKKRDPDVWSAIDNGKPSYYRVNDPLLLQSITAAGPATSRGVTELLAAPARVLRGAVVFDPAFALAHNARMGLHGWNLGLMNNPLAGMSAAVRQWKGLDPVAIKLMAAGALPGHYDTDMPMHIRREIASPEYQASIIGTPLKAMRFLHDFGEKVMLASDVGPRVAVYEQARRQGLSEGEAIDRARDMLDFSTHGAGPLDESKFNAPLFLTQTIPFLNARWQGLSRTYRGLTGPDRNSILLRGALITAATLALWDMNKDDPEWQRKEDWDRQYAWQIPLGGGKWARLPRHFELGALFGSIPEMMAEYLYGNISGREAMQGALGLIGNVFKFDPIPVAIRPALEVLTNRDLYTGAPIINERGPQVLPSQQFGPSTSQTVIAGTQAVNQVSPHEFAPANIQHLINGYLAGWGTYITTASDYLGEKAGILPETAGPAEPPVLGRFYHETPEPSNRIMTTYYDLRGAFDQVGNSIKDAEKNSNIALANQIRAQHPEFSEPTQKAMDKAGTELSRIHSVYQRIQMNPAMTADQKTQARDNYYSQRDKLLDTLKPLLRQAEGLPAQP
jgi:hypothetical protein